MKNVGSIDKVIRIVIGLAMIAAGVVYNSWWGAVGAVPIVTALMGWCPAYAIFGIKSCPAGSGKPDE